MKKYRTWKPTENFKLMELAGFNPIPTGMLELLEIKLGERQ